MSKKPPSLNDDPFTVFANIERHRFPSKSQGRCSCCGSRGCFVKIVPDGVALYRCGQCRKETWTEANQ